MTKKNHEINVYQLRRILNYNDYQFHKTKLEKYDFLTSHPLLKIRPNFAVNSNYMYIVPLIFVYYFDRLWCSIFVVLLSL